MKWQGVIPAITTPFKPDLSVDADLLVKQVDALVRAGCAGIVALGSLGEGGSLSFDEKKAQADWVIDTTGEKEHTLAETDRLAEEIKRRAAEGQSR